MDTKIGLALLMPFYTYFLLVVSVSFSSVLPVAVAAAVPVVVPP
jgi:hypothetical protein